VSRRRFLLRSERTGARTTVRGQLFSTSFDDTSIDPPVGHRQVHISQHGRTHSIARLSIRLHLLAHRPRPYPTLLQLSACACRIRGEEARRRCGQPVQPSHRLPNISVWKHNTGPRRRIQEPLPAGMGSRPATPYPHIRPQAQHAHHPHETEPRRTHIRVLRQHQIQKGSEGNIRRSVSACGIRHEQNSGQGIVARHYKHRASVPRLWAREGSGDEGDLRK